MKSESHLTYGLLSLTPHSSILLDLIKYVWFLKKTKMQLSKSVKMLTLLHCQASLQWHYSPNHKLWELVPLILADLPHPCQCLHICISGCISDRTDAHTIERWTNNADTGVSNEERNRAVTQSWRWLRLRNRGWAMLHKTKKTEKGQLCDPQMQSKGKESKMLFFRSQHV